MKFKLDENLPAALRETLLAAGHDATTVHQEGLQGEPDRRVWAVCCSEERTLLTQDKHFEDSRKYPVNETPGIVVLRGHRNTSKAMQRLLMQKVVDALPKDSPVGLRWIVKLASIRISD